MPLLYELQRMPDVLAFLIWCFATWALGQAVFRSYPSQALMTWMWTSPKRSQRLKRLTWELKNNTVWDERVARADQLVEGIPLTPDGVKRRQAEIMALRRTTLPIRLTTYLLKCFFCQHAWSAFVLVVCFSDWQWFWGDVLPAVLGYTGVTTILVTRLTSAEAGGNPGPSPDCPGGDCGGRRRR